MRFNTIFDHLAYFLGLAVCRSDTEQAMNKTLSDMKATIEERLNEKMALEEERDYLKETIGKLQGQLNQIQAEVTIHSTSLICR